MRTIIHFRSLIPVASLETGVREVIPEAVDELVGEIPPGCWKTFA
jgi:hypothetical protein